MCKQKSTISTISRLATMILLSGIAVDAPAQLLYQWNFDGGSGTSVAPTTAVNGGGALSMSYGGSASSLYGGAGSGVSGAAGDLAFANNNTAYGNASGSGLAASTVGDINLGTLTQFTMTGWMKADGGFTAINGGGGATTTFQRVFMIGAGTPDTGSANSATIALFNNSTSPSGFTNSIQLKLGNAAGAINGPNGTDGGLSGQGTLNSYGSSWTFFAITVDLTAAANNVNFYLGDAGSLSSPITISYNNAGSPIGSIAFGSTDSALLLNRANGQRGFDGWGDDFRFYNGVLDSTAVDATRISAVPEPGTVALAGLGGAAMLLALRRRQH